MGLFDPQLGDARAKAYAQLFEAVGHMSQRLHAAWCGRQRGVNPECSQGLQVHPKT